MDATIVALLVIGVVAVALLAVWYLEWLVAVIIVIVAAAVLVIALLAMLGGLAAIPYYFAKRGRDSQPGSYTLGQLKDPKDQERK
ncbi:MAG TPA: hypothetical protein PLR51_00960 [Methanomassiliicoccales archaeon]|nr:hypothetical protein [Methanomassiliicoccales archaeon]